MVAFTDSFSGFSVDDLDAAETFYGGALGLQVVRNDMSILEISLPGGSRVIAYPKADHEPAVFTILNFVVDDIDAAVDALNAAGVVTKIYEDPDYGTDARGISRGRGPDIAWFRDPAGNVLSVIVAR
ncbi:VOC family protein [Microbacterium sp. VKM Ac-2870]|uniref:VOC family protein n=1 Tax=Microbacterium sp. VKM Ac-2870 TaxID=2783825 RepID=UPI00188D0D80|nr:VOC family protein [Microbacterium sp. VKM Ac-2870]MBF4562360.1 VOC family protein [Microbacterium sp. VKM Ac-2870]